MPRTEDIQPCDDAAGEGLGISVDETLLEGTEVTSASRSQEKLIKAQQELGQVHMAMMDITNEGTGEKVFAGLSQVDHGLISAGTLRHGSMVKHDGSASLLVSRGKVGRGRGIMSDDVP